MVLQVITGDVFCLLQLDLETPFTLVCFHLKRRFKMKKILIYIGVSLHFRNELRLHYTTENTCQMTIHAATTTDV